MTKGRFRKSLTKSLGWLRPLFGSRISSRPGEQKNAKPDIENDRPGDIYQEEAVPTAHDVPQLTKTQDTEVITPDAPSTHFAMIAVNPGTAPSPAVDKVPTDARRSPTIEGSSARLSCWAQAFQQLDGKNVKLFKSMDEDKNPEVEPEDLIKSIGDQRRAANTLPRWLENSIRSVLQFKEIFAAGASLDPSKAAPVVWKTIAFILEACINQQELQQQVDKDLINVTSLISYWENVESLYLGADTNSSRPHGFESLENALIQLYYKILEFVIEIRTLAAEGPIRQGLLNARRREPWKRINDSISARNGECKTKFDECKMKIDQHNKIKKWISEYNAAGSHLAVLQKTKVDTKYRFCGQWFLDSDEFKGWTAGTPGKEVLWLRGTTGTGKTTLISRVVQYYLDRAALFRNQRLVYIYCTKDQAYRSVLLALLRQAAFDHVTHEVFESVSHAYQASGADDADSKPFSFDKMYKDLLGGILRSGIRLRVLIDALDMCDDSNEVLKTIRDVSKEVPGGLELMVSSTYHVEVGQIFAPIIIDTHSSRTEIATDMTDYIISEVRYREGHEKLLKGKHPAIEDKLIEILCRRAGGMFRWVELQLSFFLKTKSMRLKETVEKYLGVLDVKSVAGEGDLKEAYDAIFDRNTSPNDTERVHATLIYQLMMCIDGPVDMDMLVSILTPKSDDGIDSDYIRDITQDFIVETPSGQTEFAHASVIEYLQQHHAADFSTPIPDAKVALQCLKRVSSYDGPRNSLTYYCANAFLFYSHFSWGYHCANLTKEQQLDFGITEALQNWILKGGGSLTYRQWCVIGELGQIPGIRWPFEPQPMKSRPRLSKIPGDIPNTIFACAFWNLSGLLEGILSQGPPSEAPFPRAKSSENVTTYGLDNVSPINAIDRENYSPLMWAALNDYKAIVELLLQYGANVNYRTKSPYRWTALDLAAKEGHVEIVKLLLHHGAESFYSKNDPCSSLDLAVIKQHAKVVKVLASSNTFGINGVPSLGENRGLLEAPLIIAALTGDEETAKVLVSLQGVDKNVRAGDGYTPLIFASRHGHRGVVNQLLQNNTQLKSLAAKNPETWQPTTTVRKDLGMGFYKTEIVARKVDVNAQTARKRMTALIEAIHNGHVEVVRILLRDEDLNPNIQDDDSMTALDYATSKGNVEIVQLLLQHKDLNPNVQSDIGQTAMMIAASAGHVEVAQCLLGKKTLDLNVKNEWGETAVMIAAEKGHVEVVQLLLGKKALDLNVKNKRGETAVMIAAMYGHVEVVQLLLGKKALDLNVKNKWGETAVMIADKYGRVEIVQLLLKNVDMHPNRKSEAIDQARRMGSPGSQM